MRRLPLATALSALALTLTACSDGQLPSTSDVGGALSSVASQASDAASSVASQATDALGSATAKPSQSLSKDASDTPTAEPTPTLTRTETATETAATATATATQTATQTATATATVTNTPETPTPTSTPATEPTSGSTTSPWVWVLVALLVGVLVFSLVMLGRSRSRTKRWDDELAKAGGSARWLSDTYVPSFLALSSAEQLQQSWQEGSARINDVDKQLFQLEPQAPDTDRATMVTQARTAVASLRQSLQRVVDLAVAGADGDTQRQAAAAVQQARTALDGALAALPSSSSAHRH